MPSPRPLGEAEFRIWDDAGPQSEHPDGYENEAWALARLFRASLAVVAFPRPGPSGDYPWLEERSDDNKARVSSTPDCAAASS